MGQACRTHSRRTGCSASPVAVVPSGGGRRIRTRPKGKTPPHAPRTPELVGLFPNPQEWGRAAGGQSRRCRSHQMLPFPRFEAPNILPNVGPLPATPARPIPSMVERIGRSPAHLRTFEGDPGATRHMARESRTGIGPEGHPTPQPAPRTPQGGPPLVESNHPGPTVPTRRHSTRTARLATRRLPSRSKRCGSKPPRTPYPRLAFTPPLGALDSKNRNHDIHSPPRPGVDS